MLDIIEIVDECDCKTEHQKQERSRSTLDSLVDFALVYLLFGWVFNLFGGLFKSAGIHSYNSRSKQEPTSFGTYYDFYGKERDIYSNKVRIHVRYSNGDLVELDDRGREVRNYSEEKRQKELDIIRRDPTKIVIPYKMGEKYPYNYGVPFKPWGNQYKDKSTGDIYVKREFAEHHFYVRLSDLRVMKPTEYEFKLNSERPKSSRYYVEDWDKYIEFINQIPIVTNQNYRKDFFNTRMTKGEQ